MTGSAGPAMALICCAALAAPLTGQRLPADWPQRDLEGKWVHYRADCEAAAADADRVKKWVALLARHDEHELLEWIAIYQGWRHAGPALQARDAPQWLRAAVWNLGAFDSHDRDGAHKALRGDAGRVLGWVARYPVADRGPMQPLLAALRAAGSTAADPGDALPPLDPVQVLVPWLDAPDQLEEFGDRQTAAPRARYRHQVLRALDAVPIVGHADADRMLVTKVIALLEHPDDEVCRRAFETLTRLPAALVPWRQLLRIAQGDASPARRRMATLALSYGGHPRAFFAVHEIAADPDHPAAAQAVTRLGDIGDAWSVVFLDQLAAAQPGRRARLAAAGERIESALQQRKPDDAVAVRAWLDRVAWLRITEDPRAAAAAAATRAELWRRLTPAGVRHLLDAALAVEMTALDGAPLTPFPPAERQRVAAERARLADELRVQK